MSASITPSSIPPDELIDNRYLVKKTLGKGGMAVVYHVHDKTTKRQLALKRLVLRPEKEKRRSVAELFEHEFHILSQLTHPRVITVYDYGVDNGVPYYTMELLDGGDLRGLAPLPWKKACSLLRDVCSALSLLHSRRRIHRDLTPRNIRCTRDGKAKLIDFGAMIPMGHCKVLVGTPPFTAPEAVNALALDARTDLYALGATAFYVLTRHHAFPARNFQELRDLWRQTPKMPSSYVSDIPKELDALVLSLIQLDSMARPVSAAEVMERLSVVASLESDDQLLVSNAYLSTPTLIGRDKPLAKIRKQIVNACRSRGGTTIIEGASGIGRTRFLDACVLESKLAGVMVLRADAGDKHIGNWGIARSLVSQLVDGFPKLALSTVTPYISILGHVMPELLYQFDAYRQRKSYPPLEGPWVRIPSTPPFRVGITNTDSVYGRLNREDDARNAIDESSLFAENRSADSTSDCDIGSQASCLEDDEDASSWTELWGDGNSLRPSTQPKPDDIVLEDIENPQELRPRVQHALRDWFLQISNERVLTLAVDDVHQIDEPSAAFIALLSNHIDKNKMMIVATLRSNELAISEGAIRILRSAATAITLDALNSEETDKLLGSIFGETPYLRMLANRLYAISKGNCLTVMQLAQHLIDRGLVFFQSGAWYLPSSIDSSDLPDNLSEALDARVKALSISARRLAQTFASSPDCSFSFDDCLLLIETHEVWDLIRILDELISAEILKVERERYAISQQGWIPVLINLLSDEQKRALHFGLSEVFIKKNVNPHLIAKHLLGANRVEEALDLLIKRSEELRESFLNDPSAYAENLFSLPTDWYETTESAIHACERLGRPRRQSYLLRFVLLALGTAAGRIDTRYLTQFAEQLYRDSGLSDYYQLDDSLESATRITRALELAQQRYDAMHESRRCLNPIEAIRELARLSVIVVGYVGVSYDYELLKSLPSVDAFEPLSGVLGIIGENQHYLACILSARHDVGLRGYLKLLDRIEQPDHAGLEETLYEYTRLGVIYAIGAIESSIGIRSGREWANRIEHAPLFQVNAWRIRMINDMVQGDKEKAEQCKKQMELLQIQNSPSQIFEGSQIFLELLSYARSDDLTGTKQIMAELGQMADKYRAWKPIAIYAQGEYQRIRGDYSQALAEFERTLALVQAGHHVVWPYAAFGYLRALAGLERHRELKDKATKLINLADEAELTYAVSYLKMPLALAEAKLGDENAVRTAESIIEAFERLGLTGLNLGLAYETRARVAVLLDDHKRFVTYARLCAEQYRAGHNQALTAKYERLIQDAYQAELTVSSELEHAADVRTRHELSVSSVIDGAMAYCKNRDQRLSTVLDLLIHSSNSIGGYLYTIQQNLPVLSANNCKYRPSDRLGVLVRNYLLSEVEGATDNTVAGTETVYSLNAECEWKNEEGAVFHPLLIGHSEESSYTITGVAVLLVNPDRLFKFPGDEVVALSRSLATSGDVDPIYTTI